MRTTMLRIAVVVLFLIVLGSTPALAKTPSEDPTDVGAYIRKQWPHVFGGVQSKPDVSPSVTPADKTAKMKQVVDTMAAEYGKKLQQYDTVLHKIESRRDKLAAEGKDTVGIDTAIAKAKERRKTAGDELTKHTQTSLKVEANDTPATVKTKLGPALSALRFSFKELHGSVDDIVAELKIKTAGSTTPRPTKAMLPSTIRPTKPMISVPPPRYKEGTN